MFSEEEPGALDGKRNSISPCLQKQNKKPKMVELLQTYQFQNDIQPNQTILIWKYLGGF